MPMPWEINPQTGAIDPSLPPEDPWEQFLATDPRAAQAQYANPFPEPQAEAPQEVMFTPEESVIPPEPQIGPATRIAAQALPEPVQAPRAPSLNDAILQQGQSLAEQGDLGARQAEAESLGRKQAVDVAVERQKQDEAAQEADWKYAESERKKLEMEARDLQSARVDPAKLFHDNDTWQNVALMASAFLGGFIAPMQGGRNPALETIQDMIDHSIRAQEQNLAGQRENLAMRRGLYSDFVAATGDRAKARALASSKVYDLLIERAKTEAAQFSSPIIKAQYDGKIAELEEARMRTLLKYEADKREEAREERKLQVSEQGALTDKFQAETARKSVGLGYANLNFEKKKFQDQLRFQYDELGIKKDAQGQKALEEASKNAVIFASDPSKGAEGIYRASTPEESAKINERVSVSQSIIQNSERLEELYKKTNGFDPLRMTKEAQREAEALTEILSFQIAVAGGQGQIGNAEGERFKKIVGQPDAWFGQAERARLKAIRDSVERDANNQLSRTYRMKPDGGIEQWKGHWKPTPLNPQGFTPGGRVGVTPPAAAPPPVPEWQRKTDEEFRWGQMSPEQREQEMGRNREHAEKKARLIERGYSDADAEQFLRERGF